MLFQNGENMNKLKVGKCEITTRNPRGNLVVLEGKIVEVKDGASEVQISKYKGKVGETVIRSIPNFFLTNI